MSKGIERQELGAEGRNCRRPTMQSFLDMLHLLSFAGWMMYPNASANGDRGHERLVLLAINVRSNVTSRYKSSPIFILWLDANLLRNHAINASSNIESMTVSIPMACRYETTHLHSHKLNLRRLLSRGWIRPGHITIVPHPPVQLCHRPSDLQTWFMSGPQSFPLEAVVTTHSMSSLSNHF